MKSAVSILIFGALTFSLSSCFQDNQNTAEYNKSLNLPVMIYSGDTASGTVTESGSSLGGVNTGASTTTASGFAALLEENNTWVTSTGRTTEKTTIKTKTGTHSETQPKKLDPETEATMKELDKLFDDLSKGK